VLNAQLPSSKGSGIEMALSTNQKIAIGVPLAAAVIGLGGTFGPQLLEEEKKEKEPTADVRIDSVSVRDTDSGQIVGVKVRNAGSAVAVLTAARFHVQAARQIPLCLLYRTLPSSYTYDARLPLDPDSAPTTFDHEISQSLAKDTGDHFEFRLGTESAGPTDEGGSNLYQVRLSLLYNGREGQTSPSQPFIVLAARRGSTKFSPFRADGLDSERYRSCTERVVANAGAILSRPGIRTPTVRELEAQVDEMAKAIRG
jgi:hypothetical protein